AVLERAYPACVPNEKGTDPNQRRRRSIQTAQTVRGEPIIEGIQPPLPYGRVIVSKKCPSGSLKYIPPQPSVWLISPAAFAQASLREADEVSSDDGPGCVLDWLISSVVSLAKESRVSVVRCAVVELGKGGAICVESCSDCT